MQMPDELLRAVVDFELPEPGRYGVLMCFLPLEQAPRKRLMEQLERTVREEGQALLGWREVPVDVEHVGRTAGACRPAVLQLFVGAPEGAAFNQDAFERKLYVIRRRCELSAVEEGLYIASSSSRTINYKGMLVSFQLGRFYLDLRDERCKSAMALVHSRFATNT
jgi:glutamate synthase domain-containing protein 1